MKCSRREAKLINIVCEPTLNGNCQPFYLNIHHYLYICHSDFVVILSVFIALQHHSIHMKIITYFPTGEYPGCVKSVSLKLLLVMCTATDSISQNTLLEYLTITCIFHPVMQVRKFAFLHNISRKNIYPHQYHNNKLRFASTRKNWAQYQPGTMGASLITQKLTNFFRFLIIA